MAATLTVHEATIHSMQVEIKALKVGKKQVTMGLFRQLPLGKLITPDLRLVGIPWGSVNYWWDLDGAAVNNWVGPNGYISYGRRLHIVWQSHDKLWRAIVYERVHPCWYPYKMTVNDGSIEEQCKQAAPRWAPIWHALCDLPQLFIAV